MNETDARKKAEENFLRGFNCTQSVVEVFCDELKIEKKIALKISQPFGGGACRLREMCGTVSAMLLLLGFAEGSADSSDKNAKDSLYKNGQKLCAEFREKNGSIVCRELLGISAVNGSKKFLAENSVTGDAFSFVSESRTESYYKKRPCPKLCADAAEIFCRYLNSK
jgi:C_GCAxxG_C_C family probable redox protein